MRLKKTQYFLPATELAPLLLGKLLCRKLNGNTVKLRITETESYYGENDTACHASHGKTERTKVLYEHGGIAYIYLCYGIHSLFNIVSGNEGFPEAVLIRGVEGYNGPGKLTRALSIDRSLNGINLMESDELWVEDDGYVTEYTETPRIGIDYATLEYRNKLWRFVAKTKTI